MAPQPLGIDQMDRIQLLTWLTAYRPGSIKCATTTHCTGQPINTIMKFYSIDLNWSVQICTDVTPLKRRPARWPTVRWARDHQFGELSLQVHWASHSGVVHLMCFHCLGRIRKIWQEVGGTGRTTPFATRTCSLQDKSVDVDAQTKETLTVDTRRANIQLAGKQYKHHKTSFNRIQGYSISHLWRSQKHLCVRAAKHSNQLDASAVVEFLRVSRSSLQEIKHCKSLVTMVSWSQVAWGQYSSIVLYSLAYHIYIKVFFFERSILRIISIIMIFTRCHQMSSVLLVLLYSHHI